MATSTERVTAGSGPTARPDARERLITSIADDVRRRGFYLAYVDPHPFQRIIDLRWAAQGAGSTLGTRLRTYTSAVGAERKGQVSVIVAPVNIPARGRVQAMVDRLVSAPGDDARVRHAS